MQQVSEVRGICGEGAINIAEQLLLPLPNGSVNNRLTQESGLT